jgi:hypothetical protein
MFKYLIAEILDSLFIIYYLNVPFLCFRYEHIADNLTTIHSVERKVQFFVDVL